MDAVLLDPLWETLPNFLRGRDIGRLSEGIGI